MSEQVEKISSVAEDFGKSLVVEIFLDFYAVTVVVVILDIEDVRPFLYGMFPDSFDKFSNVGFIGWVFFFVGHTPPIVFPRL